MKGVQYLFDENGKPSAVLIDLRKNRQLWEDFQDIVVARQRRKEPSISLEEVEQELKKRGKMP